MTTRHSSAFLWIIIMTGLSCLSRTSQSILRQAFTFRTPPKLSFVTSARMRSVSSPTRPHEAITAMTLGRPFYFSNRRVSTALGASTFTFQEGDDVKVTLDGECVQGIVQEVRGSGWYAVRVASGSNETTDAAIIKARGKQLSLATSTLLRPSNSVDDSLNNNNRKKTVPVPVPPPTIIDIDSAMASNDADPVLNRRDAEHLQACAHHASVNKWIMFSDLHCAPSTLDTCIQVLRKVHDEAVERNAGILFLGDFWHHRATLRVDMLNTILEELGKWQVPSIFIPGNHDQVTLGGHSHGLTPLEHSYRVDVTDEEGKISSLPGPLIFSHPTRFMNALFIPHIRDVTIMESVLRSDYAVESSCLFVHADVTGASMNDLIVSQGGVPPSCFPTNTPIYSGHFHKPHTVEHQSVLIEYIGSPYETSLAEAGQDKALLVLDSSTERWECVERIPLRIGRKHFRVTSIPDLLSLGVGSANDGSVPLTDAAKIEEGDRVVVTLPKQNLDDERRRVAPGNVSAVDAQISMLRKAGAVVEVREIPSEVVRPLEVESQETLEAMSPQSTLEAYLKEEVRRESLTNDTAKELLIAGLSLLDELELLEEFGGGSDPFRGMADLKLDSVTLQGFGSFKTQVTYPLGERGLVLVRGTNKDGGGDSNGSGKSSLAMATLWALTGTLDPRPMQDSKVSDVVNDASKSARVSVRGNLNGKPFVVTRTKTASKGALVFYFDGKDLTTQSIKDTQMVMDEYLCVVPSLLARTMFLGQFALNGLLEATDAKLKEELSLVVPLSLWQHGAMIARAKSREAAKRSAEFEGMIRLRSNDVEELRQRRDKAESSLTVIQSQFAVSSRRIKEEMKELRNSIGGDTDVEGIRSQLAIASTEIANLESKLNELKVKEGLAIAEIEECKVETENRYSVNQQESQAALMAYDHAILHLDNAVAHRKEIEQKWNYAVSKGDNGNFTPPRVCPTCQQPLSTSGHGHSHAEMKRIAEQEISSMREQLDIATAALARASSEKDAKVVASYEASSALEKVRLEFEQVRAVWAKKISTAENELHEYRSKQALLSEQLATTAKAVQLEAVVQTRRAKLQEEENAVRASQSAFQDICTSVDDAEARLDELRALGEAERRVSATATNLVNIFGPRGVQTYLLQNAIALLQSISQEYLDKLSNGTQRLAFTLDAGDRISRRAMIRTRDGSFVERPLSSLSGGQWRRCSLALSLGFAQLVSAKGRFQSSLIVLDEPLTHLDRSGRNRVGRLLRSLLQSGDTNGSTPLSLHASTSRTTNISTILVILQDLAAEELAESFDRIDEVVKAGGMSTVSIDEHT